MSTRATLVCDVCGEQGSEFPGYLLGRVHVCTPCNVGPVKKLLDAVVAANITRCTCNMASFQQLAGQGGYR